MSALALVGSVTLVLPERTFKRLMLPLVALAAAAMATMAATSLRVAGRICITLQMLASPRRRGR